MKHYLENVHLAQYSYFTGKKRRDIWLSGLSKILEEGIILRLEGRFKLPERVKGSFLNSVRNRP